MFSILFQTVHFSHLSLSAALPYWEASNTLIFLNWEQHVVKNMFLNMHHLSTESCIFWVYRSWYQNTFVNNNECHLFKSLKVS